jgi:hypothetical protein
MQTALGEGNLMSTCRREWDPANEERLWEAVYTRREMVPQRRRATVQRFPDAVMIEGEA